MKIILNNSKLIFASIERKTKGALDLETLAEDLSDASRNSSYTNIFCFNDCTEIHVESINVIAPAVLRIYKVNKTTGAMEKLKEYTPQSSEIDKVINIPLEVTLAENEYIGISGNFYYNPTGGDSFYINRDSGTVTPSSSLYLYYNIVGFQ